MSYSVAQKEAKDQPWDKKELEHALPSKFSHGFKNQEGNSRLPTWLSAKIVPILDRLRKVLHFQSLLQLILHCALSLYLISFPLPLSLPGITGQAVCMSLCNKPDAKDVKHFQTTWCNCLFQ